MSGLAPNAKKPAPNRGLAPPTFTRKTPTAPTDYNFGDMLNGIYDSWWADSKKVITNFIDGVRQTSSNVAGTAIDPNFYKKLSQAYLSDTPIGRMILRASGVNAPEPSDTQAMRVAPKFTPTGQAKPTGVQPPKKPSSVEAVLGSASIPVSAAYNLLGANPYEFVINNLPKNAPPALRDALMQARNDSAQQGEDFLSKFTYIDPKTNERNFDWGALLKGFAEHPATSGQMLIPAGKGLSALANFAENRALLSEAAKFGETISTKSKLATALDLAGKTAQGVGTAMSPVPYLTGKGTNLAISKAAALEAKLATSKLGVALEAKQSLAPGTLLRKTRIGKRILDGDAYAPETQQAILRSGLDPKVFDTPEMRDRLLQTLSAKGINPNTVREAFFKEIGIENPTRAMVTSRKPYTGVEETATARATAAKQNVATQREGLKSEVPEGIEPTEHGVTREDVVPSHERDAVGQGFIDNYVNVRNNETAAYRKAYGHSDVVDPAVADNLQPEIEKSWADMTNSPDNFKNLGESGNFPEAEKILLGTGGKPGLIDRIKNRLTGTGEKVTFGGYTYSPDEGAWVRPGPDGKIYPANKTISASITKEYESATGKSIADASGKASEATLSDLERFRQELVDSYGRAERGDRIAIGKAIDGFDNAVANSNLPAEVVADFKAARKIHSDRMGLYEGSKNPDIKNATSQVADNIQFTDGNWQVSPKATDLSTTIDSKLKSRIIDPKTLDAVAPTSGKASVSGRQKYEDVRAVLPEEGQTALDSHVKGTVFDNATTPDAVANFNQNSRFSDVLSDADRNAMQLKAETEAKNSVLSKKQDPLALHEHIQNGEPHSELFTPDEQGLIADRANALRKNEIIDKLTAPGAATDFFETKQPGSELFSPEEQTKLLHLNEADTLLDKAANAKKPSELQGLSPTAQTAIDYAIAAPMAAVGYKAGAVLPGSNAAIQTLTGAATGAVTRGAEKLIHGISGTKRGAEELMGAETKPYTFQPSKFVAPAVGTAAFVTPYTPPTEDERKQKAEGEQLGVEALTAGPTEAPSEKTKPEDSGGEEVGLDALYGAPQRATGGRIAYATGGKIKKSTHEELVVRLINKAKQAKKHSDSTTKPLLNANDDAIASALAVAQKSI